MKMIRRILAVAALLACGQALAQPEVVHFDFKSYIVKHLDEPRRYAAPVSKTIDAASAGTWTVENDHAVWRYAVQIPGASSVAFHANRVSLPQGALLTAVSADAKPQVYDSSFWKNGELWSRAHSGDTMDFELVLPTASHDGVVFHIAELQAGYRGISPAQQDNSTYRALAASAGSGSGWTVCDQNYECFATSTNQNQADSVVGVGIDNVDFCTGNLVNDTAGDFKPYITLAEHCVYSRATPYGFSFYWNATTPCGQTPGNVTVDAKEFSSGAVVVANYEDTLLILANAAPPYGANPYWAGWDASDSVTGTYKTDQGTTLGYLNGSFYGVHHGQILDRQYWTATDSYQIDGNITDDKGNAMPYTVEGWQIILELIAEPESGRITPGASGSGLFYAATNRIIGTASGVSPSLSCGTFNGQNTQDATAIFQRLDVSWSGGGTSATSLKPWLDSRSTGNKAIDGAADPARNGKPVVTLSVSPNSVTAGTSATVSWSATLTGDCTLSGDLIASSTVGGSGTKSVSTTNASPGSHNFSLTCTSEDNESGSGQTGLTVTAGSSSSSSSGGSSSSSSSSGSGSSSSSSSSGSGSSSSSSSSSSGSSSGGASSGSNGSSGGSTTGGGGGGGSLDPLTLGLLALAAAAALRTRARRTGRRE